VADTLPDGTEPTEPEADPETLAAELDLGIELSPEEQAEAEQMVARLREQFNLDEEGAPAEEPEPVDEVEPEEEVPQDPTPAVAEASPPSARGAIVIDGVEVPVEEAVAYLAKREVQREAAQVRPEPTPEPAKPPEWLDQDDPAQMAMWTRQQELENQVRAIAGNQQQIAQQQAVARATTEAESGISTFRALHPELTEDDITKLRLHAVSLDIIDGLARNRSGPDAILKALDIAYWDHPEFRARAVATPSPTEAKKEKAQERKGKLNALGGSSGSAPRQEAKPDLSTDRLAKQAAAEWLRSQNVL
jgi:hypothetical protein